ncbi:MAG: LamG domain-containing protein [Candidatus Paceibacterota bacterium]|jgi:prepilin-type N-terminal cleavage/methylation domain-containing protein|nr:LamG domain-containing protein [Candidatus Paceibacterota bacterium]MDD5555473.1 LamG domain-containing protein [Candidatus Paceibacterota bacterium]
MNKSFTLIEILVVIVIIGILSAFIIVSMAGVSDKATIAKGQAFSNSLKNALMLNLVSEWKFDGSGVADGQNATSSYTQDSWGVNNGTIVVGHEPLVKSGSDCLSNSCLDFDGSVDYVLVNGNQNIPLGSSNFTISAWVNPDAVGSRAIICWGVFSQSNANCFRLSASGVRHYFYSNDFDVTTGSMLNKWSFLALTHIGNGDRKFYLNGTEISGTYIGTKEAPNVQPSSVYIGSRQGSLEFFDGRIDEVRVYNEAVPASQIQQNYYAGLNQLLARQGFDVAEYKQRLVELNLI